MPELLAFLLRLLLLFSETEKYGRDRKGFVDALIMVARTQTVPSGTGRAVQVLWIASCPVGDSRLDYRISIP
jgi:hypothetical protein